jgi:hypothetical protein
MLFYFKLLVSLFHSFQLFDVPENEAMVVDLDVSVCLESDEVCGFTRNLLSGAIFPIPICSVNEGFKDESNYLLCIISFACFSIKDFENARFSGAC